MSGTVLTEQAGETGEIINKSPAVLVQVSGGVRNPVPIPGAERTTGQWVPHGMAGRQGLEEQPASTIAASAAEEVISDEGGEQKPHPWHWGLDQDQQWQIGCGNGFPLPLCSAEELVDMGLNSLCPLLTSTPEGFITASLPCDMV